jgi:hypothetical protein
LAESCDSRAIGYPYPEGASAEEKSKVQEKYKDVLTLRKITTGYFPASLWSGKMRLFMQSIYGSEMSLKFPLVADIAGTEIILRYVDYVSDETLQLGLWAHASPGILYFPKSDDDPGGYWFINFTQIANQFSVAAYPIVFAQSATTALQVAHDTAQSDSVRGKAESYAFSSSRIDLKNKRVVGGFEANGGAMAYGWKFQRDGHRASVVLNEVVGTGYADYRWQATTIHCDFLTTYDKDTGYKSLSLGTTKVTHGTWTDGWGEYNIFVPDYEQFASPLSHYSLKTNPPTVAPDFDFSNVTVYGYYDSSDAWIDVTISRGVVDYSSAHKITQAESGAVRYDPLLNMNQSWRINYGMSSDPGFSYELHDISSATTMTLKVGGALYEGASEYGAHSYRERYVVAGGTTQSGATLVSGYLLPTFWFPPEALSLTPTGDHTAGGSFVETQRLQLANRAFVGFQHHAWTLVIPGCDCSSVYVATHTYDVPDGVFDKQIDEFTTTKRYFGTTVTGAGGAGMAYDFTPYIPTGGTPTGPGVDPAPVTTYETGTVPTKTTEVFCYSTVLNGVAGTPAGSYESLFTVDRNYPFYSRGMFAFTSSGGRYAMSEYPNSPASVNYQRRFVGWA